MADIVEKWIRSTFCADHACVEVAHSGNQVMLRDSKAPDQVPLRFSADEWETFLDAISRREITFD